jgi:COP9 signalosome complex subunit 3
VDICVYFDQPIRAIRAIGRAIHKVAPEGHITPQHCLLLKVCLKAKCYKAALPVLEANAFGVDPAKTGVESVDIRLYYYYGGLVYTGLKQFKKAQEFFLNVISFPAYVTSEIMVESYKKFILVSLLSEGQVPSVARFAGHNFLRQVKNWCSPYEDLATSYITHAAEDLQKCITTHLEHYVKENNYGIVKQVLKSLYKENISKLTKTYLTLSLKNIGEIVNVDIKNVEEKVLGMIRNGQIYAKINQKDGMVSFQENPDQFNTTSTLNYLDNSIHNIMSLHNTVKTLDETITISQQYVQKMVQGEKGKFGPSNDEFSLMELDPNAGFRG